MDHTQINPQLGPLVNTLRIVLKERGITYRELAVRLGVSEATIKRTFSRASFSLQRLLEICDHAGLTLAELAQRAQMPAAPDELTEEQEQRLVEEPELLLVLFLLLNDYTPGMIVEEYRLDSLSLQRLLYQLDRLGLVDQMPGNHVRLKTARGIRWLVGGPIRRFFDRQVREEFLHAGFDQQGDQFNFLSGMLAESSVELLHRRLASLAAEFEQLLQADGLLPVDKRHGFSLMLASRNWTFSLFDRYKRTASNGL